MGGFAWFFFSYMTHNTLLAFLCLYLTGQWSFLLKNHTFLGKLILLYGYFIIIFIEFLSFFRLWSPSTRYKWWTQLLYNLLSPWHSFERHSYWCNGQLIQCKGDTLSIFFIFFIINYFQGQQSSEQKKGYILIFQGNIHKKL